MNKRLVIVILVLLLSKVIYVKAQVSFSKGVNLTEWYQSGGAKQIQFTKFTKQDFVNIKSLGCDVIRLPINLHFMTSGSPDYILDPLFLQFMNETINWAEELGIYLILDNHTFDPLANTEATVEDVLLKVWPQMAEHFKDRTEYVLYEILNEPHGIEVNTWNSIQQKVIDEIRKVDQKHTIVVGGADWNSYRTLDGLPNYNDEKLIYTFHFYDPFLFTHQGASWVEPTMATLSNVPFPYDASRMPALPEGLKGSWVENNYNDYSTDGNVAKIHELIDIVVDFQKERNANVFCGEFGVYIPNSQNADRVYWYDVVRSYFEEKGIPWISWDYTGGFGLFNQGGNDLFENDLNTDLTDALGFTAPPQTEFVMVPETESFSVYTDYIAQNIIHGNSGGEVDFYNLVRRNGDYGIHWTGGDQYNQLSFRFKPNKDLSQLVEEDFFVHFWARGDTPGTKFDLRFEDSHTELDGDLPWRIRSVIDESKMKFDRKWHEVIIPLSDFQEQGAWDGEWHDPIGAYDWQAVNKLEFSLEYSDLKEKNLWIDEIWVTNEILNYPDPVITQLNELKPSAIKVYPNPAREIIRIRLNENIPLTKEHIKVYDLMGHELKYELRRVSKNEVEIGLSQFSQKCLIVRIHGIDKVYTKKVIKR